MRNPLVSISCITYNHAPYIRECLDGFLMQKCDFEYEILIHDDASIDGTQEIIKEYQAKYPDIIKPILQTENQYSKGIRGMNLKFNFPRAKGKYIALCEGDDYWTDPLKLQKQVKFMESHPNVIFSFHNVSTIDSKGELGNYFSYPQKYIGVLPKEIFIAKGGGGFATASSIFLTSMVVEIPPYFEIGAPGDFCMALLAISKGEIGYIEDNMAIYRVMSKGSWSSNTSREFKLKNNERVLLTLESFHSYTKNKYKLICKDLENTINYHRTMYLIQDQSILTKIKYITFSVKKNGFINSLKLIKRIIK